MPERLWASVVRGEQCWHWTGAKTVHGYGVIRHNYDSRDPDDRVYTHRAAWWLATGYWPTTDEQVLHTCDSLYPVGDTSYRSCLRNDGAGTYVLDGIEYERHGHLWLGTLSANMRDMVVKGRNALAIEAMRSREPLRGEAAPWSRLTSAQVAEIRALCREGVLSQTAIAARFGVTQSLVSMIKLGHRWAESSSS